MKTIVLSGGFDPIHKGHIDMIREAKESGYFVIVLVNSDAWLKRKKGFSFQLEVDRVSIVDSLQYVDETLIANDEDNTVLKDLHELKPSAFGNGGDRNTDTTPERDWCLDNGVAMIYGLGGNDKQNNSSVINTANTVSRPWGWWKVLENTPHTKVKTLHVEPGRSLSMQRHKHRAEHWYVLEGKGSVELNGETILLSQSSHVHINVGDWHCLSANKSHPIVILEVQIGNILEESDIERKDNV